METMNKLSELSKNVRIQVAQGGARLAWDKRDGWQKNANDYRVTLKYQGRRMSVDYWQGIGIKDDPTAEGVIESLIGDAMSGQMEFGDFCHELGYDDDSRKAERVYRACVSINKKLSKLLGADYALFMEAERE